jgi:hypothetical protein
METYYKGHIIVVDVERPDSKSKWKPTCTVLAEDSRNLIKDLEWDLDYDTYEQAERVGLLISKKWVDETKRRKPSV